MRVAIIQESIDPGRGGAETSTLEMARALAAQGADVSILCRAADGVASVREDDRKSMRVCSLSAPGNTKIARRGAYLRQVEIHERQTRYDIVHAILPYHRANIYQPRGGTVRETVRRTIAVGRTPVDRLTKRVGRWFNLRQRALAAAEQRLLTSPVPPFVAAVSAYVQRQVLDIAPNYPPEKLRVVFNGVDTTELAAGDGVEKRRTIRRRLDLSPEVPTVLFVAHNFRLKGLAELIRAVAGLGAQTRDWCVLVAGRDQAAPYQALARRLGVAPHFRFLGPGLPPRDLYFAADALAHPTFYDPCSRVVLEALCCGLPVVTTRLNGAADALIDGRHGFVVDTPNDAIALGNALQRALAPEVRRACQADLPALRGRLSMERHARELLELYRAAKEAGL